MRENYLTATRRIYRAIKQLGDGALSQLNLDELQRAPADGMNSVAVILQHLHGNMLSRWTDFLNSDGEKPGRERDAEFETQTFQAREDVLRIWEEGWVCTL